MKKCVLLKPPCQIHLSGIPSSYLTNLKLHGVDIASKLNFTDAVTAPGNETGTGMRPINTPSHKVRSGTVKSLMDL